MTGNTWFFPSFAQDLNLFLNKYSITVTLRKNAIVQLQHYFWKKSINFFPPSQ